MNLRLPLTASLLVVSLLASHALAEPVEPPAPPITPLSVPADLCVAARAVFDGDWRVAGDPTSSVAEVCGETSCLGVDVVSGSVMPPTRTFTPAVDPTPPAPDELAMAFGVTCPTATISPDDEDSPGRAPCPALTQALGFPSERAASFARGSGPKARWLVTELYGEYNMDLTARTHIYDAATRRHLGSVTQKHVYMDPELQWVTDSCALVSMPSPSSSAHPARLLCAGKNRLVSTIAHDEGMFPGPMGARALSDTQLAMWHVDESVNVVRIVALPSGRELSHYDVPFIGSPGSMAAVPANVFGTKLRALAFGNHDNDTLHVIDPIAKMPLAAWRWPDCK